MPPPLLPSDFRPASGPTPNDWEVFGAGFDDQLLRNFGAEDRDLLMEVGRARADIRARGKEQERALMQATPGFFGGWQNPFDGRHNGLELLLQAMERYRASLPEAERASVPTRDQLIERSRESALERYYRNQDVLARGDGFMSDVAAFGGAVAGAIMDPVNLAAMALVRYPATSILKTMGIEAGVAATSQAIIEPFAYDYMNDLGIDYDLWDSAQNVLLTGAGGAVLGGAWRTGEKIAVRASGRTPIDERRAQARAERVAGQAGPEPLRPGAATPQDAAAARRVVDDLNALEAENPYAAGEPGSAAAMEVSERHRINTIRADEEVVNGAPVTPAPDGPEPAPAPRRTPEGVELVDMATLQRDPSVFQYKDADADGVTPALQGVAAWRPERAGLMIVWERADGARFVVDGHQRHALAQRLRAGGHAPIHAPVYVLRETDGVSADQAAVTAAMKNLGEGSGTALDAAYVLRAANDEVRIGLPPNSPLVKDATGLARLSDDAFGMVANGVADQRLGALVGRIVEDQALQAQVLKALHRLEPSGAGEAESMVRDMLSAPRVEAESLDLFGASVTSELLIAERAKVKQAALAMLTKNRQAFRVALQRQGELEAVGNELAARRNRDALDAETGAALRLEKEAHLKGWVSDQLNHAATELRNGAALRETVDRLVQALRAGDPGAGAGGAAPGRARPPAERAGAGGAADAQQAPARSTRAELARAGPHGWRDELLREDGSVDDIERVLSWLGRERKDAIAAVRALLTDDPPADRATKADLASDIREHVRQRLADLRDRSPAGDLAPDPEVARLMAAEAELRRPIPDEGARLAMETREPAPSARPAPGEGVVSADQAAAIDAVEQDLRELADMELQDPALPLATFIDPETGETKPMTAVLDEIDIDRRRLQVLEFCAYPGGRKGGGA